MIEKRRTRILLGAVNVLAVASPMAMGEAFHAPQRGQNIEKANAASLKSMESTWLQVPNACKARGFNASAVTVENKIPSSHVQSIYASFGF